MIDIEVANSTPSPTIDPSVHVILCGHSMGGIVGAEVINLLNSEQPIPAPSSVSNSASSPNFPSNTTQSSATGTSHPTPSRPTSSADDAANASTTSFMFPHIAALLTFDTPFLGISPGVVAHGAESHYKTASNAYKTFNEVSSIFGWGSASGSSTPTNQSSTRIAGALPAPSSSGDAAAAPTWQSWGKYAMFAGAAGAVAAGASAALYSQRDNLSMGWSWVTSHLEFVGCLARGEELKQRILNMTSVETERGLGFIDFYTVLGKSASEGIGATQTVLGDRRTFCSVPKRVSESKPPSSIDQTLRALKDRKELGLGWHPAINDKATDEIVAHMSMFFPRENPGFYTLGNDAKDWLVHLITQRHKGEKEWYEESDEKRDGSQAGGRGITYGEVGMDGWEKPDYETQEVRDKVGEKMEDVEAYEVRHDEEEGIEMREEEKGDEELEGSIIVDKPS